MPDIPQQRNQQPDSGRNTHRNENQAHRSTIPAWLTNPMDTVRRITQELISGDSPPNNATDSLRRIQQRNQQRLPSETSRPRDAAPLQPNTANWQNTLSQWASSIWNRENSI